MTVSSCYYSVLGCNRQPRTSRSMCSIS
jgi:hypothetical protein